MNTETPQPTKQKRRYRRITPQVVSRFQGEVLIQGNGTKAVEVLEPDAVNPASRAHDIATKAKSMTGLQLIDEGLDRIAGKAIERIEAMVSSTDQRIATKNAHFVVDHVRGKAVQRTENKNYNLNIGAVLE